MLVRSVSSRDIDQWLKATERREQKTNAYIRLRSCVGKMAYASKSLAENAVARTPNKKSLEMHAYQCRFCNLFHIGH